MLELEYCFPNHLKIERFEVYEYVIFEEAKKTRQYTLERSF